jgi:NDP-sugar pyrophosphorylase family protein
MRSLPVAILAGGLATRLGPLTERFPKSLIAVNGEPFVSHQLRLLRSRGVDRAVLCVGHLGQQIRDAVGDGSRWGIEVEYSFDGDVLLGTGGALRKARPSLGDRFFVLYGDSYLPIDFRAVQDAFAAAAMPALMTVLKNEGRWDSSNVLLEGGRIVKYDKRTRDPAMHHIDYGLGVLESAALESYPADGPFDLAEVYGSLAAEGRLAGFEVATRFYEIGSTEGIRDAEAFLSGEGAI